MKADRLSNHSLTMYQDCPHKYYLNYHGDREKNHMQETEHLDMGTMLHKCLEILRKKPDETNIEPTVSRVIRESDYTPEFKKKKKMKELLVDWLETRDTSTEVIKTEMDFNAQIDDEFKIHGYIDLVEKVKTDHFRIRDYKTGKNYKDGQDLKESTQLKLYTLAVMEVFDVSTVEVAYDQIRFGPPDFYQYSKSELHKFYKYLKDIQHKIANDIDHKPNLSYKCAWCDYNDSCQFVNALDDAEELKDMKLEKLAEKYSEYQAKEKTAKKQKDRAKDIITERLDKADKDEYDGEDYKITKIQREYEYYRPRDLVDIIDMSEVDEVFKVKKKKLKEILAPSDLEALKKKKKTGKGSKYVRVSEK